MSSSDLEKNKIFAAILVAGIVAMLAGFVADHIVHSEELEEDAYPIEVSEADQADAGASSAPKGPEPIDALMADADIAQGEKLSKACMACHSFEQGGPNKIGPNLWGVYENDKGTHADFAYSDAMLDAEGTWTTEDLNAFLWKPKKTIAGTKMNYIGMKKPEDRADIIKYLQSLE